MAVTLRLEDRKANTTIDLQAGADSIYLARGSWRETMSQGLLSHTMRLLVDGGTKAATRTATLALVDLLEQALDWTEDPLQHESVWLRFMTDGETDKRALVVGYELRPVDSPVWTRGLATSTAALFDLALTTLNVWEDAYYNAGTPTSIISSGTSALNVSINGGTFSVAAGGDVDGRLWYFDIYGNATHKMAKIWAGIRPTRLGTASFTPRLDAGAATAATDTALDTGNSGYSDTGTMLTDFATDESLQTRFSINIGDEDMFGRYLVLVRHRYDGIAIGGTGTDFAVRVNVSLSTTAYSEPLAPTTIQYIGSENWTLTEIGEIQLPPAGLRDAIYDRGEDYYSNMQINFEAARVGSTLDLVVDCLILIPAEHMITVEGDQDADTARWTEVHTYEHGDVAAYEMAIVATNDTVIGLAAVSANNWASPHDGGVCVIAAAPPVGTAHDATEVVDVIRTTVKRYRTYHD